MQLETNHYGGFKSLVNFSFLLLFTLEHLSASGIWLEQRGEMPKYYGERLLLGVILTWFEEANSCYKFYVKKKKKKLFEISSGLNRYKNFRLQNKLDNNARSRELSVFMGGGIGFKLWILKFGFCPVFCY